MAWQVVHSAPDQTVGESLIFALKEHNINGRIHPGDTASFLGVSLNAVRIEVDEKQAEKARQIIAELLNQPDSL